MDWTVSDFVFAGAMLAILGAAGLFLLLGSGRLTYRLGTTIAVFGAIMLFWVTGAVGIIGSEGNAANLLYLACIPLAFIGALITRFRAGAMANIMYGVAGAIALIGAVAVIAGLGKDGVSWPVDVIGASVFFVMLFGCAGVLFRTAGSPSQSAV